MTIVSEDNKLFKRALKLKERKFRDLQGEYLVEGLRGVVDTSKQFLREVFVTEGFSDSRLEGLNVTVLSPKLMNKLSETSNCGGVVAIAQKKPECDFELDKILYLDRIRDPGNMGTIIRTAVAAGYEIVCDDCVDVYNPKVVRSCVSALSKARLHVGNFIDILIKKDYNIIGADANGECAFGLSKPQRICLVIGNEANGIRNEILDKCNFVCSIPMENMESLNASVSAAVLMYYYKFI